MLPAALHGMGAPALLFLLLRLIRMHDKWILEGVRAAHLVVANMFSATVPVLRRLVTKEALLAFELYVVTSDVPPATFLVDSPPGQVCLTAPPGPCKSIKT